MTPPKGNLASTQVSDIGPCWPSCLLVIVLGYFFMPQGGVLGQWSKVNIFRISSYQTEWAVEW